MRKIVLLLLIGLLLIGCERKCGDVPEFMKFYLPYKSNQVVVFANENQDTIRFVTDGSQVEEKNYRRSAFAKCDDCGGRIKVELKSITDSCVFDRIFIDFNALLKNYNGPGIGLSLICNFFSKNETDSSWDELIYGLRGFDPYNENSAEDVPYIIEIKSDYIQFKVNRAVMEKYKGLVEFDDKMNNCTWKLVE